MLGIKYLFAGEPVHTFQKGLDTGVLLAAELMRREIPVDYCDLSECDWRRPTRDYLSQIPVRPIHAVDAEGTPPFLLGSARTAAVDEYAVILQRKDPPVDENYIGHARHFALAPRQIIQMNNPDLTWRLSEHLLPRDYPGYGVATFLCKSFEEFSATVRAQPGEAVVKPLHFFSGVGIEFFSSSTSEETLHAYWLKWKPQVVVQPYLEEVTRSGDLRVLVMNGRVLGSVLRKPKVGSRLANLHQGGSAHRFDPTPRQLEAAQKVSSDLCPKGLYLLGLDFIGDFITEINITCPSAVPQINQVMGTRADIGIIDELEKMRQAVRP